jgi:hypothetical protein
VDDKNANYSSANGVLFNKNKTVLIQCPSNNKNTQYVIPSSVTTIGDSAFRVCEDFTSITIPSSVTAIGNGAFIACRKLTSITIPSGVTAIGGSAFALCDSLKTVSLSRNTKVGEDAFPSSAKITYYD